MAKKRKKLTSREFWEKYREQFARTDRHLKEVIAELDAKIAQKRAVRGEDAA
jgi:hypothetical protein